MKKDQFCILLETLRSLPSEEEMVCPRTQRKLKVVSHEGMSYLVPNDNFNHPVHNNFICSGYLVLSSNIVWDNNIHYYHFKDGAFLLSNEYGPAKMTEQSLTSLEFIRSEFFIDGRRFSKSQFDDYRNKMDLIEKVSALD